jgi:hypothetical protein
MCILDVLAFIVAVSTRHIIDNNKTEESFEHKLKVYAETTLQVAGAILAFSNLASLFIEVPQ